MKLGLDGKAVAWAPAAVGFLLHAGAARWMFELKVRRLEAIRKAEFVD